MLYLFSLYIILNKMIYLISRTREKNSGVGIKRHFLTYLIVTICKNFLLSWILLSNKRRRVLLKILVCDTRRIDAHPSNSSYWLLCVRKKREDTESKERKKRKEEEVLSIISCIILSLSICYSFISIQFIENWSKSGTYYC